MESLITPKPKLFIDSDICSNANDSLVKLFSKCNCQTRQGNHTISAIDPNGNLIGEYLPIGINLTEGTLTINKDEFLKYQNINLALVVFNNENTENVFLFEMEKILSNKIKIIFKVINKKNIVIVNTKKIKNNKIDIYKFGMVLKEKIKI